MKRMVEIKRIIALILFFFSLVSLKGQNIEDCGKDDNPLLTRTESIFLKEYLKEKVDSLDFENKRILFVTGSGGSLLGKKSDYFNDVRKWREQYNSTIASSLILLTDEEKLEYGYDAILTQWVKVFTSKARKKVLKKSQINENTSIEAKGNK
jgi:hypothetical protein